MVDTDNWLSLQQHENDGYEAARNGETDEYDSYIRQYGDRMDQADDYITAYINGYELYMSSKESVLMSAVLLTAFRL